MRPRKHHRSGLLVAILATVAVPVQAGVKEGVDAWQAGDYPKAVAEWSGPAEKGDADAQFNLGQAYKLGRGVPADGKLAQDWYLKAAQQGHSQAQANLGLILFQNGDREAALPWIQKAADRGEPRAQYVLGIALFNGDLVQRDLPRAYALMTRAAAAGLPQATTSIQQMDGYLSIGERQAGLAMAKDLADKAARMEAADASSTQKVATSATASSEAAAKPAAAKATKPAPVKTVALPASSPPPAKRPATAPDGKGWKVQLGAFSTSAAAERAWAGAAKISELGGASPSYTPVNNLTRLQAGPFAGAAEANRVCKALAAKGQGCFPVAP